MPRYEGMDDLLQRVRDRLEVVNPGLEAQTGAPAVPGRADRPERNERYESTLEVLLLLLRDAEQLGELVLPEDLYGLTREQREDLESILAKVLHQLWSCKAALDGVKTAE